MYAVFSYDAQQPDELKFSVNDKLTILRKGDESEREWWWARNTDGIEGYVPRNLFGVSSLIYELLNDILMIFLFFQSIYSFIQESILQQTQPMNKNVNTMKKS